MVIPAPGPGFSRREASNYCNFLAGTGEHILVQIAAVKQTDSFFYHWFIWFNPFQKLIAEQTWLYLDKVVGLRVQRDPVSAELLHPARVTLLLPLTTVVYWLFKQLIMFISQKNLLLFRFLFTGLKCVWVQQSQEYFRLLEQRFPNFISPHPLCNSSPESSS